MKLNVEELMREAEKLAAAEQNDAPYNNALGPDWFSRKHEAFARLIVERCAVECEYEHVGESLSDESLHEGDLAYNRAINHVAWAIRNLLEDK